MSKPLLLDLFCGAGGAAVGYHRAGFDVIGVDFLPQPRYPFRFIQADCLNLPFDTLDHFDAIHASPPCQGFSCLRSLHSKDWPNCLEPAREILVRSGLPYVIENVIGAPLLDPIVLCGVNFGLRVYRHRSFESNRLLLKPSHMRHRKPTYGMSGKPLREGDFITVAGHVGNLNYQKRAMQIDWMKRGELAQAIPPAYTEYIGHQLRRYVD